MQIAKYLTDFLKALEVALVPPPGCHHAITVSQYGSEEQGWKVHLRLLVHLHGTQQTVCLYDDDLPDRDPKDLAADVCRYLTKG